MLSGLTVLESRFLEYYVQQAGICRREETMKAVYGAGHYMRDPGIIKVVVCHLRKKLKTLDDKIAIISVGGGGYRIDQDSKDRIAALVKKELTDGKADTDQAERGGDDVPGAAGMRDAAGTGAGERKAG